MEDRMVELYPRVAPDSRFWTEGGQLKPDWKDHILEIAEEATRLDSKPGQPWIGMGCNTIRDVLTKYGEMLGDAVAARVMIRIYADEVGHTAFSAIEAHIRDVVRLFVKNEPHSKKKLDAGRFRLIMNSSLTDIVVDRIAFDALRLAEIAHWAEIPSKAGIGFDDEHIEEFHRGFTAGFKDYKGADVKAWDWNVKPWQFDMCARVEIRQYGVPSDSQLARLIRTSSRMTTRKVFALPDGRLVAQYLPGIQESGSLPTIMHNSKSRVGLGLLAGAEDVKANGDDTVEKWPGGVVDVEAYARYGFTVEVPELPEGVLFEFCSYWWSLDESGKLVATPCNWGRTFYRLLGHPPSTEQLAQFMYEMRNSPALPRCLEFLRENGWGAVVASMLGEA